jgi:hypothetical protein
MSELTYSAEELREMAKKELDKNNFEAAQDLAENAADTEAAQNE